MRFEEPNTLVLSRRNLLSLLAKMDGHPPSSWCVLQGGDEANGFWVAGEEDDVHYADRPAGEMHPDSEEVIQWPSQPTAFSRG